MTVNDASLGESGSKLSKVAATSLLMGVTRASSEAYGVVGREVLGQHTPQAACLQYIHDGIHDVSKGVFSLSVLWVKNIFGNLPLFVSRLVGYWFTTLID